MFSFFQKKVSIPLNFFHRSPHHMKQVSVELLLTLAGEKQTAFTYYLLGFLGAITEISNRNAIIVLHEEHGGQNQTIFNTTSHTWKTKELGNKTSQRKTCFDPLILKVTWMKENNAQENKTHQVSNCTVNKNHTWCNISSSTYYHREELDEYFMYLHAHTNKLRTVFQQKAKEKIFSWKEADTICQSLGGYLPVTRSRAELTHVARLFRGLSIMPLLFLGFDVSAQVHRLAYWHIKICCGPWIPVKNAMQYPIDSLKVIVWNSYDHRWFHLFSAQLLVAIFLDFFAGFTGLDQQGSNCLSTKNGVSSCNMEGLRGLQGCTSSIYCIAFLHF